MRVLFAGSPRASVGTLSALHASGHTVVGVLTQPPKPFGRKKELRGTPVFDSALANGIPLATPQSAEGIAQVAADFRADIAIVIAFGRILTPAALATVPGGWWNVHFSRLPDLRGAAPVAHTVLRGDSVTAVTLFKIVEELDAGPIVACRSLPVSPFDTAGTLLSTMAAVVPDMVLDFLDSPGNFPEQEQEGPVTFAPKFPAGFGELNLAKRAVEVHQLFRAVTPEPGAFVRRVDTGAVVKILSAWTDPDYHHVLPGEILKAPLGILVGTATNPLVVERVHPAGKKPMEALDWFRGLPGGVRFELGKA